MTELLSEGVLGCFSPPGIWGFRKDDRKRNGQPITISTLRFENLTTALDDLNSQSSKALDFV